TVDAPARLRPIADLHVERAVLAGREEHVLGDAPVRRRIAPEAPDVVRTRREIGEGPAEQSALALHRAELVLEELRAGRNDRERPVAREDPLVRHGERAARRAAFPNRHGDDSVARRRDVRGIDDDAAILAEPDEDAARIAQGCGAYESVAPTRGEPGV